MKKSEIKVGGLYLAKVAGSVTTVRVDATRGSGYNVTNLRTGRKTTFRSAAKFRCKVNSTDAAVASLNATIQENIETSPREQETWSSSARRHRHTHHSQGGSPCRIRTDSRESEYRCCHTSGTAGWSSRTHRAAGSSTQYDSHPAVDDRTAGWRSRSTW